jgi:hypothetical protein
MDSAPAPQPVVVVAQPRQTVWWIIAICLAIIATALVMRPGTGPFALPAAFGDTPMAGARGIFAFTGQIDTNRFGLFMMDVDSRNVWCYEYLPSTRKLRLVFARSFDFDRYLEDYNLDTDTNPEHIKKMLEEHRKIKERKARNGEDAAEGDGGLSTSVPGMPPQDEPPAGKP